MDIFPEKRCSQEVNAVLHGLCGLSFMVDSKEDTGIYKLKGLDKKAAGFIIINSIHLRDKGIWIFRHIFPVILISASFEVFTISPLFISLRFFLEILRDT